MSIEALYKEFISASGVTTDTRSIKGNELFFALKGERFDGNNFVQDALEKGCRLAVADRPVLHEMEQVIIVKDTLATLQQLAAYHRRTWAGKVIAVTGSNGKTTTKELLHAVLAQKYRVLATEGNLNNHIGVPLTLLKIRDEQLAIVEMGANHAGEIAELCMIAAPDTGLITNIGKAHLEGFGNLEGVKKAKGEMYDYLEANRGTAIADMSDPVVSAMVDERNLKVFSYGEGSGFDVEGHLVKSGEFIEGSFGTGGEVYPLKSGLFGAYNFRNLLAAAAAGVYMEVPPDDISAAAEGYVPRNNRSQILKGRSNTLIMDAYNANPTSMSSALSEFEQRDHPEKIVILGDMFELGEDEHKEHQLLLTQLSGSNIQQVMLVGERFAEFKDDPAFPFHFFGSLDECLDYLREHPPSNALIMLKGSRKNALENATNLLLNC